MNKKPILTSSTIVLLSTIVLILTTTIATTASTTAVFTPTKTAYATTNEIDDFGTSATDGGGESTDQTGDESNDETGTTTASTADSSNDDMLQTSDSSPISDDTSDNSVSSADTSQLTKEQITGSVAKSSSTDNSAEYQNINQVDKLDSKMLNTLDNQNKSGFPIVQKPHLVNLNAYNYQTNPAKDIVTIYQSPIQMINTLVTDSFSHGVANIPIEIKVMNPAKNIKPFAGKTDILGKNTITIPVTTAGTWTAEVTIKSPPTVGGPFKDTITWKAVGDILKMPPIPTKISKVTYTSKIAYNPVDLSNDPRQQILTTVKSSLTGNGIKNVPLTIKLTNADGISKTFSRITDSKGVDAFVTFINKQGNWKALVSLKSNNGMDIYKKEIKWTAIP